MKKSVLLTGATGAVGKEVLNQLIQNKDIRLFVLCRSSATNKKFLKKYAGNVHVIFGDLKLLDCEAINQHSFDVVIHLAAIIPKRPCENEDLIHKVNAEGTRTLIRCIEKSSPQAFFMYSSSIAVYGDRLDSPMITVHDELPIHEEDAYAKSKVQAEHYLKNSKLNWTIFRLSAIMGVNNHKMSGLMFYMPLETRMEIATPEDAGRAFVNGLEYPDRLSGKIFNLGGGEACRTTYRSFLENNFKIRGLGALNFPGKTFAEKNYHCGDFADGDELEKIILFRRQTLADYYKMNVASVSKPVKLLTHFFRGPIKYFLRQYSIPLRAHKNDDVELKERFFNSEV